MSEKISIKSTDSVLIIREDEVKEPVTDPLSSNFPQWTNRRKCFEAYICFIMSFSTCIQFCKTVGEFGIVVVVPFSFFRVFIGIPFALVEIMLARYVMGNIVGAWAMCPFAKGILYCFVAITFFATLFNNISLTYTLKYLVYSFNTPLSWETCSKKFSKTNCFEIGNSSVAFAKCLQQYSEKYCANLHWETAAAQFWRYRAGNTETVESVVFSFINLIGVIAVIIIVNYKGIYSCEKTFSITVYLPVILACIFAFATFLIPGATYGLKKILYMDWSLLENVTLWTRSFEETLLSLGLGMLSLSFISSHGDFFDDILLDVIVVVFADIFCLLLISLPILSIMGKVRYSFTKGVKRLPIFEDKLDAFIAMSEALTQYPYPNTLWSFILYLELSLISFGTQAIQVLAVCEAIGGISKGTINLFFVSCIYALCSIVLCSPFLFVPYDFSFPLATCDISVICLGVLTLTMFYGVQKYNDDFHFMMGYGPTVFLKSAWILALIVPAVFLCLKLYYRIPNTPIEYIAYIYSALPVGVYLSSAGFEIFAAYKHGKITDAFLPNPHWGPSNPLLMNSRIMFNARAMTKEFMYRQQLYKKCFIKQVDFSEQNIVQPM